VVRTELSTGVRILASGAWAAAREVQARIARQLIQWAVWARNDDTEMFMSDRLSGKWNGDGTSGVV